MLTVFALLIECRDYPDSLGYHKQFEAIVRFWRPGPEHRAVAAPFPPA